MVKEMGKEIKDMFEGFKPLVKHMIRVSEKEEVETGTPICKTPHGILSFPIGGFSVGGGHKVIVGDCPGDWEKVGGLHVHPDHKPPRFSFTDIDNARGKTTCIANLDGETACLDVEGMENDEKVKDMFEHLVKLSWGEAGEVKRKMTDEEIDEYIETRKKITNYVNDEHILTKFTINDY